MVVPPDLEQLRRSLASGLMYPGPMQDAASFLLSLVDEGGRLERVVLCEHGFDESHRVFTDARGMERCAKGSRTVAWPPKEGEQEAVSHG